MPCKRSVCLVSRMAPCGFCSRGGAAVNPMAKSHAISRREQANPAEAGQSSTAKP